MKLFIVAKMFHHLIFQMASGLCGLYQATVLNVVLGLMEEIKPGQVRSGQLRSAYFS